MNPGFSRYLSLVAFLLAFGFDASAQMTVKDDLGRPILISKPAMRIVTLAPSLTEMVFAAGIGSRLIGVAEHSAFPPEAKKLPQVYTGAHFRMDQLAGLKPDLVLAYRDGIRREDVEEISRFGANVFVANARSLHDVSRLLSAIGTLTGRDVTDAVNDYERKLEGLRRANQHKPRISAFMEIWNRPLTTVTANHFLGEALELCRADNVFDKLDGRAPQVSWQEVEQRNPYVIVGAGSAASAEEFRSNWKARRGIGAVQAERMVFLDSEAIQSPTLRTPEGIAQLCAALDKMRPAVAPAAPEAAVPTDGRRRQYGM
jgi:iron complex transport system substrate-binding protein